MTASYVIILEQAVRNSNIYITDIYVYDKYDVNKRASGVSSSPLFMTPSICTTACLYALWRLPRHCCATKCACKYDYEWPKSTTNRVRLMQCPSFIIITGPKQNGHHTDMNNKRPNSLTSVEEMQGAMDSFSQSLNQQQQQSQKLHQQQLDGNNNNGLVAGSLLPASSQQWLVNAQKSIIGWCSLPFCSFSLYSLVYA